MLYFLVLPRTMASSTSLWKSSHASDGKELPLCLHLRKITPNHGCQSTARLITMTTYFRFTASFIYWRFLFTSSCKPNVEGKAGHWLAALLSIFHHVWCSINMLTAHVISLFNIFGLPLCGPGLPVFIIRDIPWVCSIYHLSWWSNGILLFFL